MSLFASLERGRRAGNKSVDRDKTKETIGTKTRKNTDKDNNKELRTQSVNSVCQAVQ